MKLSPSDPLSDPVVDSSALERMLHAATGAVVRAVRAAGGPSAPTPPATR